IAVRSRECVGRSSVQHWRARPEQRITLVEPLELRERQPRRLNELELSRDVGVEANEAKSALHRRCAVFIRRPDHVFATAPQDPMKARRRDQIVVWMLAGKAERPQKPGKQSARSLREIRVPRVRTSDVRAVWARIAISVVMKCELIELCVARVRADACNCHAAERNERRAR